MVFMISMHSSRLGYSEVSSVVRIVCIQCFSYSATLDSSKKSCVCEGRKHGSRVGARELASILVTLSTSGLRK